MTKKVVTVGMYDTLKAIYDMLKNVKFNHVLVIEYNQPSA